MPKRKTDTAKKSLLRRVRRPRLKHISILPSLITILNGVCGFTAILLASKGAEQAIAEVPVDSQKAYFAMSGYMILLAMIADMLDGRLARRVEGTSSFGGQLDSLCDVISFGAAPVFLMLKIVECKLELTSFRAFGALECGGLPPLFFLEACRQEITFFTPATTTARQAGPKQKRWQASALHIRLKTLDCQILTM